MIVKLGEYVRIRTGKLDANAASENGQYPFFTCAIESLRIDTYNYDCECVLVAGNGDLNVKYYSGKFNAYQRTYIIESNDKKVLTVPYLYTFLDKYVETLRQKAIGGVIKYIKLENLTEAQISIPNEETQNKTVEIIYKVKNIISLHKQQLFTLDTLIKARFVEMFGCIDKANYVMVKDVCSIITDGTHQPPKFVENGIPFIFVSNLSNNEVTYEAEKFITDETYNELIKRTPIEIGDILLTTVGSYGHSAVVKNKKKFLFQRHIAYLKPKHDTVDSEYLRGTFLSSDGQRQIEEKVKGIAQKTLNLSEIRNIIIPLPSIEQQKQYSSFVTQVDKSKAIIQKALDEAQLLFDSLMQKYFG